MYTIKSNYSKQLNYFDGLVYIPMSYDDKS